MKPILALSLLLHPLIAEAIPADEDFAWVIGGGPDVFKSQVQIERNVLWVLQAMEGLPGERNVRVFFTDGDEPTPDIHEWAAPPEAAAALQPLARVFNSYWRNGLRFRNHRIPAVVGTTAADRLTDALGADFRALHPGDRGWLLFIGHGTYHEDLDNRLELWNDTELGVGELQALLDEAPQQSRLRFLFTQCYSGAFAELATPGSNRCGFMAAAADEVSEGCSPAIEKRDYEDYSTYFFAALTGRPRDGAGLDGRPDWNTDGRVTPLEAHFHVLATAFSADIPRATSEVLLMQWQPGNLTDLLAHVDESENEYTGLALQMMRSSGIDPGRSAGEEMYRRQSRLQEQWERLEQSQERLREEIVSLQQGLQQQVLGRWPAAGAPYTLDYTRFLAEDLGHAQAFIEAHSDYPQLRQRQELHWQQDDLALQIRRAKNQLRKIGHLLRLGRLKAALERDGPEDLVERYRALRECESAPF
ncbi:MAG: hypothetical protein U9Q81_16765 [Pseudomonadota bacterium]|nr:hypothetical protein [Pseudomonadota bacterium]